MFIFTRNGEVVERTGADDASREDAVTRLDAYVEQIRQGLLAAHALDSAIDAAVDGWDVEEVTS